MADRTMTDIALNEKALEAGAEAVLELWRKQGLENCSSLEMAEEAISAYLRTSPSQVAPQPQAGEAVAWTNRLSDPTKISPIETPEFDIPLYASPQPANPARTCTCHPDDNPPKPCSEKYALSECRKAADERVEEALRKLNTPPSPVQKLGAAISRRDWHEAEQAHALIRDALDGFAKEGR